MKRVLTLLIVSIALLPTRTEACSIREPAIFAVAQTVNANSPPTIVVSSVAVKRGVGPVDEGCGSQSSTSCDDLGVVSLTLDGMQEQMGIVFETEGNVPKGLVPTEPVAAEPELFLFFIDGATDEQEAVDFRLRITSVNAAGEMGATSEWIRVYHPGKSEGCATAPGKAGSLLPFLLLAGLLLVWRPRRSHSPK